MMIVGHFPPFTMSRSRYERLSKVVFRKPTAMVLDKNYARMVVQFPELVIVDEKHKGLKHPCEYQSYEPSKPTPVGHWIMEASIRLPRTGVPFLFQEYGKVDETMTLLKYIYVVRLPFFKPARFLISLISSQSVHFNLQLDFFLPFVVCPQHTRVTA